MAPQFTVICPTWNRGPALRATIESVLAQTTTDLELVVASDASSDDTDDVVRDVARVDDRVRLLRTRRYGFQAGPTNEALAATSGEYVAYIDHDDLWHPDHLAVMARLLATGADLVASRAHKVEPSGVTVSRAHPLTMLWHPQAQVLNPLFENSCAAHRRWAVEAAGGWTESPVGLEDWDLWLRMSDAGAVAATTLRTTVDIVELPTSRQRSRPVDHTHRLATFDDARGARAAIRRLTDQRVYPEAREACIDDLQAWYGRLADAGELVFPERWATPGSVPRDVVASHVDEAGSVWGALAVVREDEGWTVAIPIGTMTAEHARRFERMFVEQMPRQQAFLESVLQGRPPSGPRLVGDRAV